MAFAETAHLVAQLDLKDNFTPSAKKAISSLGKLESTAFRVGQNIGKGLKNAATNLRNIGLVAAAGIAAAVKGGIDNLAKLEDAEAAVTGAIKRTHQVGKVTAKQISGWANEIEASIGAAFDDKEITQSAATLIRFGKVTTANLRPALVVMTDLATKTGSVDSAASLLAKALADPTKAAGKLARSGLILTKEQQKQINAFVKAGKLGKAQKVVLDALAKSTKGAAAASQGPYRKSLSVLADVTEDAQKALAIGFLPVLEKVSGILSTELAKPSTLKNIREFGEGLAGGLDTLIGIAQKLPFDQIGASLKLAGEGAKAVLGAFTSLPPWVQTAVLTGWGLNKLTGGALGGIVGEIGKGLVKGVLGMNAGVVNIKAGVVTGAGGAGAGVAAAGKTGLSTLGKVALIGEAVGLVAAVIGVQQAVSSASSQQATELQTQTSAFIASQPKTADLSTGLAGVRQGIKDLQSNPLNVLVQGDALDKLRAMESDIAGTLRARANPSGDAADRAQAAKLANIGANTADTKGAVDAAKGAGVAATSAAGATVRGAVSSGASQVAGAVRAARPIITTTVNVSVTAGQVQKSQTTSSRYGPPNGSRGTRNRTGVE